MTAQLVRAAQAYAALLGFSVFPVGSDCRKPLCRHGYKDASTNPNRVISLWKENAGANIALACGEASGVWVLDVDTKGVADGLETLASLEAKFGPLPPTWLSQTPSGGQHVFFRHDPRVTTNRVNIRPGLDVRTTGGSVALPPSRKPTGGYSWLAKPSTTALADAPDWLLAIVDPPVVPRPPAPIIKAGDHRPYVTAALLGECREVSSMGPGSGRNHQLFKSACKLGSFVGGGLLGEDTATEALLAASHDCGLLGEDGRHAVMATIKSGLGRGAKNPREMAA